MKKILALILAVIMAASVCVIASSAAMLYNPTRYLGEHIANMVFESQDIIAYGESSKWGAEDFKFIYDEDGVLTKVEQYENEAGEESELSMEFVIEMTDATHGTVKEYYYINGVSDLEYVYTFTLDEAGRATELAMYSDTEFTNKEISMVNTFDANGNLTKRVLTSYNAKYGDKSYTYEYTYDENNNRTSEKTLYDDGSYYVITYTYDSKNRILTRTYVTGDKSGEKIHGTNNYNRIYDEDGNYVQTISLMDSDFNYSKSEVTVDENGKDILSINYYYDESQGGWVLDGSYEYTYDAAGRAIKLVSNNYDENTEEFVVNIEYYFTYPEKAADDDTPVVEPEQDEPAEEEVVKPSQNDNPPTGDAAPVVVLASVMALSLAGVVITKKLAK